MERVRRDAAAAALPDDSRPLRDGGTGATAYAEAVAVYLAFAISKLADRGSSICTWFTERDSTRNTFARQSIPMTWDFSELNMLLDGTGSFVGAVEWTAESTDCLVSTGGCSRGSGHLADAVTQVLSTDRVISTDPPYYDNIGYADLSDFFYVWLRRSLRPVIPELFSTMAVPKADELVATALPSWDQSQSRRVLHERYGRSDEPIGAAGTSRVSYHHLLRVQAIGNPHRRRYS